LKKKSDRQIKALILILEIVFAMTIRKSYSDAVMITRKTINLIFVVLVCAGIFSFSLSRICQADSDLVSSRISDSQPLWEVGLFNVVARLPHYRGSDETTTYAFPLPYLIYRGDFFQMNRDGVKGIFLRSESFELDTSLYGNPPVDGDNQARSGMEELEPTFEIGPSLKWFPFGRQSDITTYFKAAVRGVGSIDFPGDMEIRYQGIHGEIEWISQVVAPFGYRDWLVGVSLGADFTNREYNRYFYDVSSEYVRNDRPAYQSSGGYGGAKFSTYAGKKITPDITCWAWFRWENIDDAVFEDSPLVRDKNNFSMSLALSWTIARSTHQVTAHMLTHDNPW